MNKPMTKIEFFIKVILIDLFFTVLLHLFYSLNAPPVQSSLIRYLFFKIVGHEYQCPVAPALMTRLIVLAAVVLLVGGQFAAAAIGRRRFGVWKFEDKLNMLCCSFGCTVLYFVLIFFYGFTHPSFAQ